MKNCKFILCALALVMLCVCAATAGDQLTFKFKAVKVPGAAWEEPGGINNKGVSVGFYVDSSGIQHGYILNGKKLTTLDDPNGTAGTTSASNLNPDGAISVVGFYTNTSGVPTGFLYKGGKYTDISGPTGNVATYGSAINDSGAVVGYYEDSAGVYHGFLLKGKNYTTMDVPGAIDTFATGINKSGDISFYWVDSSGVYESSVYNAKTKKYTTIDVPGAEYSFALDLNAVGDVTYEWEDSSGAIHGALLHANKYYKYDFPNSTATYGGGINDKNNIVGGYQTASGGSDWFAFEATY